MEMFTAEFFRNYVKNLKPLYDLEEAIDVLRAYGHIIVTSEETPDVYSVLWVSGKLDSLTSKQLVEIAQET